MEAAQSQGIIVDSHITACGDDLQLIMTHERGVDDEKIHGLAWEVFTACAEVAKAIYLFFL